jgi:hypothetical protein
MSIIISVKHLPTGETWESKRFSDDRAGELHDALTEAVRLNFSSPILGTVYFPPGVLDQCVFTLRNVQ